MQLDHVIIGVSDLDAATGTFATLLGRPAAVRSDHPTYGTRNALFLFDEGPYLELLGLQEGGAGGSFVTPLRDFLTSKGEGLYGLALAPDDIDAAVERLRSLGFKVRDAAPGTGVSADGRAREWRNTRLAPDVWHGSFSLLIEHHGWDWRTDLRVPPVPERADSAATGIHHVVFDVIDAATASALWAERFGLTCSEVIVSEAFGAEVRIHPAGTATIEAVGPTRPDGAVAKRMAARGGEGLSQVAFAVADVDAAVAAVRAAGLAISDPAPGVLAHSRVARVEPGSAHGTAVQLIQFA